MGACKSIVSKQKIRFREDGFDLDLTYITPRIIAMGFPAEGIESAYRNRMADVQRFFDEKHKGFFRIYNLCSERAYSETAFGSPAAVERHPFDDHNPCPLRMARLFCESVAAFLEADKRNVVAVHCKAGKGRTGMMISAYLLHSGTCRTAEEALRVFGEARTRNGKGVTIPSQRRYVEYYAALLKDPRGLDAAMEEPGLQIKRITMSVSPNFDRSGGCEPFFKVYQYSENKKRMFKAFASNKTTGFEMKPVTSGGGKVKSGSRIGLDVESLGIKVKGDTKIVFFDKARVTSHEKMFWFWFHTYFIDDEHSLTLRRPEIDKACACKEMTAQARFPGNFEVTVHFGPAPTASQSGDSNRLLVSDASGLTTGGSLLWSDSGLPPSTPSPGNGIAARYWLRKIFCLFDPVDDGFIDVGELVQILETNAFGSMSKAQIAKIAHSMDDGGDGAVSYLDFERLAVGKLHLASAQAELDMERAERVSEVYHRLKEWCEERYQTNEPAEQGDTKQDERILSPSGRPW